MSSVRHPREEKVDAKKRWKKVTMERIRLKTNGFERDGAIPTDRRVSNETSFSHARPSREKSSRGCFVTRRNNASEVSVLISHHFLSLYIQTNHVNVPFRETTRSPSRDRSSLSTEPASQTKTPWNSRAMPPRDREIANEISRLRTKSRMRMTLKPRSSRSWSSSSSSSSSFCGWKLETFASHQKDDKEKDRSYCCSRDDVNDDD